MEVVLDELFTDVGEVAEDVRAVDLVRGQTVSLHVKVESGGPFELLVLDPNDEIMKTFSGISREHEFELTVPKNGGYGFAFQSTGKPGMVRLKVSSKP
jgi:hypothetical protein